MKQKFSVSGMTCSNCSSLIKKTLQSTDGITEVVISVLTKEMDVEYSEDVISIKEIENIVNKLGYKAKAFKNGETKSKTALKKLITSVVLLVILFYLANYNMFGFPLFAFLKNYYVNSIIQLVLTLVIIAINFRFYKSGFMGIIKKAPNMDTLIMLSSSSAVIYGIVLIFFNVFGVTISSNFNMLYFESGAMVIVLVSVGKYIESKAIDKTTKSIKDLVKYLPNKGILYKDNKEVLIDIEDIKVGDILLVKEGNSIPCDGIVQKGSAAIDESLLTGEAGYYNKKEGDAVYKATTIKEGFLIIEASKKGTDSMYDEVIELINNSCVTKAKIGRLADKVCNYFVPIIILLSIITLVIWLIICKDFNQSFSLAISVLVVSCPCALGLATPVAITCATGKAYKSFCLVKEASTFESLAQTKYALFDKTGTITEGKMKIESINPYNITKEEFLKLIVSIEKLSTHPLAKEISKIETEILTVEDFKSIPTKGIEGYIQNKKVICGNNDFFKENNILIPNDIQKEEMNIIYLAYDGKYCGNIVFSDNIKSESIIAMDYFKQAGIKTVLISGDSVEKTSIVAKELKIDEYYGKVFPKDKNEILSKYKSLGNTVFIGDGINDSIAITNATVSMAIGAGADIAKENADVVLKRNNLLDAYNLIELSKKTLRIIKENLFWAFIYNIILIPIAMGSLSSFDIYMKPSYGAIAMCLSSLFVVCNALRINTYKYKGGLNVKISVPKMMCSNCENKIIDALKTFPDLDYEINLKEKTIKLNNNHSSVKQICKVINDAGYQTKILK